MFVLPPPPPRHPGTPGTGLWGNGMPGAPPPVVETNNVITYPEGPEYQFSVGEGTYILKEDIFLATPPPHPSESPITTLNPLSTAPQPTVAGTKLSLVAIKSKDAPSPVYHSPGMSQSKESQSGLDPRTSADTDSRSSLAKTGSGSNTSRNGDGVNVATEKFGGGNASLSASSKDAARRKKPKNNIAKNNSTFVSRIISHENLAKRLAERNSEDLFVFANINRAFNWLDLGSSIKQEPLSKILFTKAHPLCHDVNLLTKSSTHLDVIIGFSSGDIVWFDPVSNKYARLNKNGMINSHAVADIKWIPGTENLFLAAHQDGSLIVYDKEKEDAPFMPEDAPDSSEIPEKAATGSDDTASLLRYFSVNKSVESKNQRTNPVSYWSVSRSAITAFAFSPDCQCIAVVAEDQCLRVINIVKEKLLDVYSSYYGGLMCVCWSPDGRYVVTGGQDDLVSIWSFHDRRIVARCEGHHSWVSSVAFDPWRCDDRTYRFGSVGNDCRLLLWDFSVGMLHKPKASMSSHNYQSQSGRIHAESLSGRLRSNSNIASTHDESSDQAIAVHPVEERARTAVLPPIMSKVVDAEHLTQLVFLEDSIITTCTDGHLKTWNRPHVEQTRNSSEVTLSMVGS
ncbi:catabolite repression protein creC [Tuber borchii]|uniref:Catabolite repression protein creC n=1 Tax=Tuber borchii TaxID=42251 RepID=A0A2T7A3V5_TUBBO|nr:catabolite repression protein creC [Tuber borchii]